MNPRLRFELGVRVVTIAVLGLACDRSGISITADAGVGGASGEGGGRGGAGGVAAGGAVGNGGAVGSGGAVASGGAGGLDPGNYIGPLGAACTIPAFAAAPTLRAETSSPPPQPSTPMPIPPMDVGPAPLRTLDRLEYVNTVRDLLGSGPDVTAALPQDSRPTYDVRFASGGPVASGRDAAALMASADALAAAASERLDQFLPSCCLPVPDGTEAQKACAAQFVVEFGRRAFRRPLANDEGVALLALYDRLRSATIGADFPEAIRALIAAMLQAPQFLYHREQGPRPPLRDGPYLRLGPYEMASRLSYFLWASMPDPVLFAAADAGRLETIDEIAAQARRMLASPKARAVVEDFYLQWLEIADLAAAGAGAPRLSPELAQSMVAETRAFVDEIVLGTGNATLTDLLVAPWSYLDAPLAKLYGVAAPAGPGLQRVQLDPAQRAGIFTQASFLAWHANGQDSSPDQRGRVVLAALLCLDLPSPPVALPDQQPLLPGQTTRERHMAEIAPPQCASCHGLMDPPGFAFEHYDGLGTYRTSESGKLVDASGAIDERLSSLSSALRFRDAIDLMSQLAKRPEVTACMVRQWYRYAVRRLELDGEGAALDALSDRLTGAPLREILVALAQTRSFRMRQPGVGEKP
jgi:hypothetical protein